MLPMKSIAQENQQRKIKLEINFIDLARRKLLKQILTTIAGIVFFKNKILAFSLLGIMFSSPPQIPVTKINQDFAPALETMKCSCQAEQFTAWKDRVRTEMNNWFINGTIEKSDTPPPLYEAGNQTFTYEEGIRAWEIYEEEIASLSAEVKERSMGMNVLYVMTDEAKTSLEASSGGSIDPQWYEKIRRSCNTIEQTYKNAGFHDFTVNVHDQLITIQDEAMNALDTREHFLDPEFKVNSKTIQLLNQYMADPESGFQKQMQAEAKKLGWENYHVVILTKHGESAGKTNYLTSFAEVPVRGFVIGSDIIAPEYPSAPDKVINFEQHKSYDNINDAHVEIPNRSFTISVDTLRANANPPLDENWIPQPPEGAEHLGRWSSTTKWISTACTNAASTAYLPYISDNSQSISITFKHLTTGTTRDVEFPLGNNDKTVHIVMENGQEKKVVLWTNANRMVHWALRSNMAFDQLLAVTPQEIKIGLTDFQNEEGYQGDHVPDITISQTPSNGSYRIPLGDLDNQLIGESNGTNNDIDYFNIDQTRLPEGVTLVEEGGEKFLEIASLDPFIEQKTPSFTVFVKGYAYDHKNITTETTAMMITLVDANGVLVDTKDIKQTEFKVYPNPFTDYLHIDNAQELSFINIYDSNGRSILTINTPSDQIDLRGLDPGMYIVQMVDRDGNFIYPAKSIEKVN